MVCNQSGVSVTSSRGHSVHCNETAGPRSRRVVRKLRLQVQQRLTCYVSWGAGVRRQRQRQSTRTQRPPAACTITEHQSAAYMSAARACRRHAKRAKAYTAVSPNPGARCAPFAAAHRPDTQRTTHAARQLGDAQGRLDVQARRDVDTRRVHAAERTTQQRHALPRSGAVSKSHDAASVRP